MRSTTQWFISGSIPETPLLPLRVLDIGGGDGIRARRSFYPGAKITTLDLRSGWDIRYHRLPTGPWDVLLVNHLIEHLYDPDRLLEECARVSGPNTLLNLGTPNLAAWFNRGLFLAGYVPHSMELSLKHNVGKPFHWNQEGLGGHVRVFTLPALSQLLQHHGFNILDVVGESSTFVCHPVIRWVDRLMTAWSPTLASAIRVYARLV